MSDGVHDYLPKMRIDTQNGHSLTYLDDQQIASHLRENGGLLTETCIHTLAKLSISRLNQARIESLQRSQEATKQLPQAQETMQVELAGIASEKQTNNESWEKVPAMPPEQQTDEKKRLGAIDKLLLRRQEQAQSSIEVLIKQQQFELGDDFTIVGIPVF